MLINGRLEAGHSSYPVRNPATNGIITEAPQADEIQLNMAVDAARKQFDEWSVLSFDDRRIRLAIIREVLETHTDELAALLTQEQGRPIGQAKEEVSRCAKLVTAICSLDIERDVHFESADTEAFSEFAPLGVVAAIPPWNYPLLGAVIKIVSAAYVGNTVVVKPSPLTPVSLLKLGELIVEHLPKGLVNIVSGDNDLGQWMTTHDQIDAVSFTGSVNVGKQIMAASGAGLKRLVLELGGNDAAIVLDDVDPVSIVSELFNCAFTNSGQVCIAIKRLYIHESVYEEVCRGLVVELKRQRLGDGSEDATTMGPLQTTAQVEMMRGFVEDAVNRGATVLAQSTVPDLEGSFFPVTLLTNVPENADVMMNEAFGPILPIVPYRNVDDAISLANSTSLGLGGSIWSGDVERAKALALRLQCGTAWVNQHKVLNPMIPFGGLGDSGIQCELGTDGLKAYMNRKVVHVARI